MVKVGFAEVFSLESSKLPLRPAVELPGIYTHQVTFGQDIAICRSWMIKRVLPVYLQRSPFAWNVLDCDCSQNADIVN